MRAPVRQLIQVRRLARVRRVSLVVVVSLFAGSSALATSARAVGTVDARVSGSFVMRGQIVSALRVRGEHRGQSVTRSWAFTGESCTAGVGGFCQTLALRRERSAHRYDLLTLHRVGVGRYAGSRRFYARLRCRGRLYPRGEVVPYRITVGVIGTVPVQGLAFASGLTATYTDVRRIDRTPCPIGPSHDSARYVGVASPPPSAPTSGFRVASSPTTDFATFTDTSTPGGTNAPIVSRSWNFGDRASGAADTARGAKVSHTFSARGIYLVSLTVVDATGLASTESQPVIAAGPPSG